MRKFFAIFLAALMILSFVSVSNASDTTLLPKDVSEKAESGVALSSDNISGWDEDGYIGFSDVDFTGAKSIRIKARINYMRGDNGEAFGVYIDDPIKGECIGYIIVNEQRDDFTYYGVNITGITGKHNLYLKQNYTHTNYLQVAEVVISGDEWVDPKAVTPVPDSNIKDTYSDTWVAVDNVGRRLADFEETGPVKEGKHDVLIFYHDWHIHETEAVNAMDVINAYPEAKDNYYHEAWPSTGPLYWGEPVYGYYTGMDYWHYRKSAELMASAGIDAVYIDYTNSDAAYIKALDVMMRAYHDAREDGVDVPKIGGYLQMGGTPENKLRMLKALYFNLYQNEYYKDLWYLLDGKPLVIQGAHEEIIKAINSEDSEEEKLVNTMLEFFTFRATGGEDRDYPGRDNINWHWLVPYPQPAFGTTESGRVEMVNLGMAINRSYIGEVSGYWIFSGKYAKTKNYTEAFGDDYRPEAVHEGYFFREQASRVLDLDPEHVMVDGWNEWNTARSEELYGYKNVFIDLYDNAGSRDFEPHKGELKDDYYMLLTDFIRKYKGVRPVPTASGDKTIDINGDISQWGDVAPEFINHFGNYERDEVGYKKYKSDEFHHYTTEVVNSIASAKVAKDSENFYFYVKCEENVKEHENGFMNIYINADRNKATGWEGYDYAINVNGKGVVSAFNSNEYALTDIGTAGVNISGNALTLKLERGLISETDKADFEFKITDNIMPEVDLMLFYTEGNSAPVGRFNYLYTEIPQTALTNEERSALSDTTVLKAGSAKMIVDGGKMYVYDKDIRVTAFAENNTVYVPMNALEDIMGYGETKVTYDYIKNVVYIKTHELTGREITDYQWAYAYLDTNEARVDGMITALSNPVKAVNGIIYVPVSLLSECFGWDVVSLGDGAYAISQRTADADTAKTVLGHLN